MNFSRKQLTQIGLGIVIVIILITLVAFGGNWFVETIKEMHGM